MAAPDVTQEPLKVGNLTPSRRAVLTGMAASSLAACSRTDRRRLTFWAMDATGENVGRLFPAFTAATGIAVDLQWLPATVMHQKLLTAFAGGTLPDVMMLANPWVSELAMVGAIAPLPRDRRPLLADQFPGVVNSARANGVVHALPWTVDTLVQYYRRDLLAAANYETPPLVWAEWKAMLHAVRQRQASGYALLMHLNWPDHLLNFAVQCAAPMLRDRSTRGAFREPAFLTALAFYKSLFDEGLAPRVVSTEMPDPGGELARGYIAVHPGFAWTRDNLTRRSSEIARDRWGVAAVPGPSGVARGAVLCACLGVAPTAPDPAAAWDLVRFLCLPAQQLRLEYIVGELPSRPSAWTAPLLARDPVMRTFAQQFARAGTVPAIPEWPRIVTEMQLIAEGMVRGGLTVDAAATAMNARADTILAKRRWLLDRGLINQGRPA